MEVSLAPRPRSSLAPQAYRCERLIAVMTAIEHPANHRQIRWTRSTVYLDMWVDADDDA